MLSKNASQKVSYISQNHISLICIHIENQLTYFFPCSLLSIYLYEDGVIGVGIAVTAVGLVAGGIAAALSRKK